MHLEMLVTRTTLGIWTVWFFSSLTNISILVSFTRIKGAVHSYQEVSGLVEAGVLVVVVD